MLLCRLHITPLYYNRTRHALAAEGIYTLNAAPVYGLYVTLTLIRRSHRVTQERGLN